MVNKSSVVITEASIVPGFSANVQKIVNSCVGLSHPNKPLAINVPINRKRDGRIVHCPVITELNKQGGQVEAELIESDNQTINRFAYGFTLCVDCLLKNNCPNFRSYANLIRFQ